MNERNGSKSCSQSKFPRIMSEISTFHQRLFQLNSEYEFLVSRPNIRVSIGNGLFERYNFPVLTALHVPLHWKFDLNPETNPNFLIRQGVNAVYNAGAIEHEGKIALAVRMEGYDRKSFFAIAESLSGTDRFHFREFPIQLPAADEHEINLYDMRLTRHEDGWIYGVFGTESRDFSKPQKLSASIVQCGIARTKDLDHWERLPNLQAPAAKQRDCVLHPEFVDGKYAFYIRARYDPKDDGMPGGIAWGLCDDITRARIDEETLIEKRRYHTINEQKSGLGPAPIKTAEGWLQLAHGVRKTPSGMRYVLYLFLTALDDPSRLIARPGGYFMAPEGQERVGDASNVLFSNGWVTRSDGSMLIYYGSSDTRIHVVTSSVDRLLDYVLHTPPDGMSSHACLDQRIRMIRNNKKFLGLEHF